MVTLLKIFLCHCQLIGVNFTKMLTLLEILWCHCELIGDCVHGHLCEEEMHLHMHTYRIENARLIKYANLISLLQHYYYFFSKPFSWNFNNSTCLQWIDALCVLIYLVLFPFSYHCVVYTYCEFSLEISTGHFYIFLIICI